MVANGNASGGVRTNAAKAQAHEPDRRVHAEVEGAGVRRDVLEAECVYTQGRSFEEARKNVFDVIGLMLEEAPHQFFVKPSEPPPGAITERVFVLVTR